MFMLEPLRLRVILIPRSPNFRDRDLTISRKNATSGVYIFARLADRGVYFKTVFQGGFEGSRFVPCHARVFFGGSAGGCPGYSENIFGCIWGDPKYFLGAQTCVCSTLGTPQLTPKIPPWHGNVQNETPWKNDFKMWCRRAPRGSWKKYQEDHRKIMKNQ